MNGEPRPCVGKSRREARRVSEILSIATGVPIEVQGVVADWCLGRRSLGL